METFFKGISTMDDPMQRKCNMNISTETCSTNYRVFISVLVVCMFQVKGGEKEYN